jgi:ATP-dependent RNA helicase DDX23/PRP28
MNAKKGCDTVSKFLDQQGMPNVVIHGDKAQDQRSSNLDSFKRGEVTVLVATDVAARGIDISGIGHVINYDMAHKVETYTHRIGRTGRAGKKGVATTFLTLDDHEIFYELKEFVTKAGFAFPHEIAKHESTLTKPGGVQQKKGGAYKNE